MWGRWSRALIFFVSGLLLLLSAYRVKTFIDKTVLLLMLVPWLSLIPAYLLHGQSMYQTSTITMNNLAYSIYFLLWRYKKVNYEKLLICFGLVFALIYIVQQVTYPTILFSNTEMGSLRGSNVRFSIFGNEFLLFLFLYAYVQLLNRYKTQVFLLLIIICAVTIYFMSVRQIYLTMALTILLGLFMTKRIRLYQLSVVSVVGIVIYMNFDDWFGAFIEMSGKDDWSYEARTLSWIFYGITYNKGNLLAMLLGNGDPYELSEYGKEIAGFQTLYREDMGLWRSDIGIVGTYSLYGAVYIAVIIYFFYHVFKERKYFDLHLQLFALFMLFEMPMIQYFQSGLSGIVPHALILYLYRVSYLKNKKSWKTGRRLGQMLYSE